MLKTLDKSKLESVIKWAADEGWNPGIDDANAFFNADPRGFMCWMEDEQAVASISIVHYNDTFSFLGLYISHPDFRHQGKGWQLWQAAMQQRALKIIALDGVPEQQDNYRKSGFEFAWRNIRYSGSSSTLNEAASVSPKSLGLELLSVEPRHIPALINLDEKIGGVRREKYIEAWCAPSDSRHSVVAFEGSEMIATGTIRQCEEGFKVGPLLCQSDDQAMMILKELVKIMSADQIIIDIPQTNNSACELATRLGLQAVFETARMYRGPAPAVDIAKLYGVMTLELG